jgi:hypothetical protein
MLSVSWGGEQYNGSRSHVTGKLVQIFMAGGCRYEKFKNSISKQVSEEEYARLVRDICSQGSRSEAVWLDWINRECQRGAYWRAYKIAERGKSVSTGSLWLEITRAYILNELGYFSAAISVLKKIRCSDMDRVQIVLKEGGCQEPR